MGNISKETIPTNKSQTVTRRIKRITAAAAVQGFAI